MVYLAQESPDLPLLHAKSAPKLGNSANELREPVLIGGGSTGSANPTTLKRV
jgi:hypothetical protein